MNHIITAMVIGVITVNCIAKTDLLETSDKIKLLYRSKLARAHQSHNLMPQTRRAPHVRHTTHVKHTQQLRQAEQRAQGVARRHSVRSAKGKAVALALPSKEKPFEYYKVLVVLAPPEVHMSGEGAALLIYIVFPDDGGRVTDDVPTVYFVSSRSNKQKKNNNKKAPSNEPILIIDNNRRVTGLKSKQISKYVTFKNKLSLHDNFTFSEV